MISSAPPAASDYAGIARALREGRAAGRARRGRQRFYPEVGDADWQDWRWQFRHRLTSTQDLAERLVLTPDELACGTVLREFPMGITPYFLSLVDPDEAADPLRRRLVPRAAEAASLSVGIDDEATQRALCHALMLMRVRPYYLYHCDPVRGADHFRTTIERGVEIIESLRGHTSGLAVPQFVVDAPGGGGKIPVNPHYVLAYQGGRAILRNFQGRIYEAQDPVDLPGGAMPPAPLANPARGVEALAPNGCNEVSAHWTHPR